MWEYDAISGIEFREFGLPYPDGYQGFQEVTVLAWIELGRRELIPACLFALAAHLPDKVVGGLGAKPQLHHTADAESLILTSQEAPCALQHPPELHKACLVILNLHNP